MSASFSQYFSGTDYALALPMLLLTLFGLGILIIDLLLPREWKIANAWTALIGLLFSALAVFKVQVAFAPGPGRPALDVLMGFGGSVILDRFAIFFLYLFLQQKQYFVFPL